jgi:hypothetical protein
MTDIFDDLDAIVLGIVGDPIEYQVSGFGPALQIRSFADHGDQTVEFGATAGTVGDASIQIRIIDVAIPNKADVITLPRIAGQTFRPARWERSRCGRFWNVSLKRAS